MATTETELTSTTEAPPAAVSTVKVGPKIADSVLDKVLRLLSSVRFGIVMLSILLSCCMLGMLVMNFGNSGGPRKADPVMATGLIRIGEAAARIHDGSARRTVAHATSGPCLQHNLVCVLEAGDDLEAGEQ